MDQEDITSRIIECCFEVMNELGTGFLESVYEKALLIALKQKGFEVSSQVAIDVHFRGSVVGQFYADVLVNGEIILELKTVDQLHPTHQAQLINYLKATRKKIGLLINFGKNRIEIKRCYG